MSKLCACILGNYRNYEEVNYYLDNKTVKSKWSVYALYELLGNIDKVIVFIPSTLKESIGDISIAKDQSRERPSLLADLEKELNIRDPRFLESLAFYVVPNVGIVGGKVYRGRVSASFSAIYAALVSELEKRSYSGIVLDLSHGFNVLVISLLLAGITVGNTYGLNVEAYASSIFAKSREKSSVKTEEKEEKNVRVTCINDLLDAVNLAYALQSVKNLDERPLRQLKEKLSKEDRRRIFETSGAKLASLIDFISGFAAVVRDLREGSLTKALHQIPVLQSKVEENLRKTEEVFSQILNYEKALSQDFAEQPALSMIFPMTHMSMKTFKDLFRNIRGCKLRDFYELINLLYESENFGRAALAAREAVILAKALKEHLDYKTVESKLGKQLSCLKELRGLLKEKDIAIDDEYFSIYSKVSEARNIIAHIGIESTKPFDNENNLQVRKVNLNKVKNILSQFLEEFNNLIPD